VKGAAVSTRPTIQVNPRRGPRPKGVVTLVAAVGVALAAPAAAHAARQPVNTFAGSCQAIEGMAFWPEQPLRLAPTDTALVGDFPRSGSCSGTLNGREVDSRPASVSLQLRGTQSCAAGATSGRFTLEIAGRTLTGKATYRRVSTRVNELLQGDAGGAAVLLARAQVGLVSDDDLNDPLADTPVGGGIIAGPVSADEALRACAQEGIRQMPIRIEQIISTPSISSPKRRPASRHR
jgi:hypothetical protein